MGAASGEPTWGFIVLQHPDDMKSTTNRRKVHHHVRRYIRQPQKGREPRHKAQGPLNRTSDPTIESTKLLEPSLSAHTPVFCPTERRAHEIRDFLVRRNSAFCMKVRELCFSLALFDDGSYYFALAEMALHGSRPAAYTLPHAEDAVALQHYTHAVAHVKQRMTSAQPYQSSSHQLLGVVLGLASYDVTVGNMDRWKMHMAGLELLIARRGGLQACQSVYFQLSLLWTEVTGGLVLDQPPRFDIPLDIMQPYCKPSSNPLLERNLANLRQFGQQLHPVASVMELLTGVASSFVRQATHVEYESDDDDYHIYCVTRARTSYILLQVERLDSAMIQAESDPKAMVVGETIRLAALLFLLRLTGFTPGTVPHHTDRLSQILEYYDGYWSGLAELQLWVLAIAAVMMNDNNDRRRSVVHHMKGLLCQLQLSWDELPDILHEFAWVHGVFNGTLLEVRAMLEKK